MRRSVGDWAVCVWILHMESSCWKKATAWMWACRNRRTVILYFRVSRGHDDGELSLLIVVRGWLVAYSSCCYCKYCENCWYLTDQWLDVHFCSIYWFSCFQCWWYYHSQAFSTACWAQGILYITACCWYLQNLKTELSGHWNKYTKTCKDFELVTNWTTRGDHLSCDHIHMPCELKLLVHEPCSALTMKFANLILCNTATPSHGSC